MILTEREMIERMQEFPAEELFAAAGLSQIQLVEALMDYLSDMEENMTQLMQYLTSLDNINEED